METHCLNVSKGCLAFSEIIFILKVMVTMSLSCSTWKLGPEVAHSSDISFKHLRLCYQISIANIQLRFISLVHTDLFHK